MHPYCAVAAYRHSRCDEGRPRHPQRLQTSTKGISGCSRIVCHTYDDADAIWQQRFEREGHGGRELLCNVLELELAGGELDRRGGSTWRPAESVSIILCYA